MDCAEDRPSTGLCWLPAQWFVAGSRLCASLGTDSYALETSRGSPATEALLSSLACRYSNTVRIYLWGSSRQTCFRFHGCPTSTRLKSQLRACHPVKITFQAGLVICKLGAFEAQASQCPACRVILLETCYPHVSSQRQQSLSLSWRLLRSGVHLWLDSWTRIDRSGASDFSGLAREAASRLARWSTVRRDAHTSSATLALSCSRTVELRGRRK